jgi:hypothetical protein
MFYQVPTFSPLLRASQGSTSTDLCYASPAVWTSVGGNNYAQWNNALARHQPPSQLIDRNHRCHCSHLIQAASCLPRTQMEESTSRLSWLAYFGEIGSRIRFGTTC